MNTNTSYQGVSGKAEFIELGNDRFIKVYNNTGGTLSNGNVVIVSFVNDGSTTYFPIPVTPATTAVPVYVGVVDNSVYGKAEILDKEFGFVKLRGITEVTKTTANAVLVDDYLQATNGILTANAGAYSTKSFGIAKSALGAAVAGKVLIYLFGERVTI